MGTICIVFGLIRLWVKAKTKQSHSGHYHHTTDPPFQHLNFNFGLGLTSFSRSSSWPAAEGVVAIKAEEVAIRATLALNSALAKEPDGSS